MPQKLVCTLRYEIPVNGEGRDGYRASLDQADRINAAIEQAGAKIVNHQTAVRQVKIPKGSAVAAAAPPAHGHLTHP